MTNDDVTIMMVLMIVVGHAAHVLYARHSQFLGIYCLYTYNVISKLRFGRDMLGFTLGLPVRPRAYMVSNQRKKNFKIKSVQTAFNKYCRTADVR